MSKVSLKAVINLKTVVILLSFIILLYSSTPSYATSPSGLYIVGPSIRIGSGGGYSVTADTNNSRYLATWSEGSGGFGTIFGQLIDSKGSLYSSRIQITPFNSYDNPYYPRSAFDSFNNRFLVVWRTNGGFVKGIVLNADGSFYTPIFDIGSGDLPDVAFDSKKERYLVVYTSYQDGSGDIYGREVTANGLVGPDRKMHSTQNSDQMWPRVAFDSTFGRFFVVWSDSRNGFWSVYGRFADGTGLLGSDIEILGGQERWDIQHEIAFDNINNRFLVVWDNRNEGNIYGSLVNFDGTLFADRFLITRGMIPVVSYDSVNLKFLVGWWAVSGSNTSYARLVNPDSTLEGTSDINIGSGRPSLAFDPQSRRFLRVGVNNESYNNESIYGQLLGYTDISIKNLTIQDQQSGNELDSNRWYNYFESGQKPYFSWQKEGIVELDPNEPYKVYFGQDSQASAEDNGQFQSPANYSPLGLENPSINYLKVVAKDDEGNYSFPEEAITYKYDGTPPDSTKQENGTNFKVTAGSPADNTLNVSWPKMFDNANGLGDGGIAKYYLYRKSASDPDVEASYQKLVENSGVDEWVDLSNPLPEKALTTLSYADTLATGQNYSADVIYNYKIKGIDAASNVSNYSGVSVSLPATPTITLKDQATGFTLDSSNWYNYFEIGLSPYFSWVTGGAVLDPNEPYKVYFGEDSQATAEVDGTAQMPSNYSPLALNDPSINYLKVIAKDMSGNFSYEGSTSYKYDGTPPDSTKQENGTNFKVTAGSPADNTLNVSWPKMFDNANGLGDGGIAKYYLYRKSASDPDVEASYQKLVENSGVDEWVDLSNPLPEKALTTLSYADTLATGQNYSADVIYNYKIKGIDAANNISSYSPASISIPASPTTLQSVPLSSTSIRWTFSDNSTIEDGFILYDESGNEKGRTGADANYIDEGDLIPNTPYPYYYDLYNSRYVVAYNEGGESARVGFQSVRTLASAPGWIKASDGTYDYYDNKIAVSVANLSNDQPRWTISYRIYRDGLSGTGTLVFDKRVDPQAIESFIDTVTPGTHTYYAYSVNADGVENPDYVSDTGFTASPARSLGRGWHELTEWSQHDPDAGKWSKEVMPHKGLQTSSNQCKVCHAVHDGASDGFKLLRDNSRLTECYFCHGVTGALTAIYYKPYSLAAPKGEHTIGAKSIPQSNITTTNIEEEGLSCGNCHSVHDAWTIDNGAFENQFILRRDPANNGGDVQADGLSSIQLYDSQHRPIEGPSNETDREWRRLETEAAFCADCHNKAPNWDRGVNNGDDETPNPSAHRIGKVDGRVDIYGQRKQVSTKMTQNCNSCHNATTWVDPSVFPHQSIGHKLLDDDYTDTSEYLDNGGSGGYTGDPTRPLPNLDEKVCRKCHEDIGLPDDPNSF